MKIKLQRKVFKLKLKFGFGNSKLSKLIVTFSLPAGYSCPFALKCLSKANPTTGKIQDGPETEFRCFAASQEIVYPTVRRQRWHNFNLLRQTKTLEEMCELIQSSLPSDARIIRVHVSGDFWSERYFLAWLNVAWNNPHIVFYGYTKAIPYLVKYKDQLPNNFRFTGSIGGTHDFLIHQQGIKYAQVVFSVNEAKRKGLEIDHDDSHAINSNKSFALLLHGTQPAKSKAAKAWEKLQKDGIGGYSKNKSRKAKFEQYHPVFNIVVRPKPDVKKKKLVAA